MRRSVRPIEAARLPTLTTARLLAYRDKLLGLEESADGSDLDAGEVAALDATRIHFKSDPRWKLLHESVSDLLVQRGHPPKGPPVRDWESEWQATAQANARRARRDNKREAALVQAFCQTRDSDLGWFADALADPDKKWFVLFLVERGHRLPDPLYAPMIRAAARERDISRGGWFVRPCVAAAGPARVIDDLLNLVETGEGEERAGAVKALYYAHASPRAMKPDPVQLRAARRRKSEVLLRTFIETTDLYLRRCIALALSASALDDAPDLRPLLHEARSIAATLGDATIDERFAALP